MKSRSLVFFVMALSGIVALPCTTSIPRAIWSKPLGSTSDLFAFERGGKVGFIDRAGRIVIQPTIAKPIEQVGDFSDGLARIGVDGYIDTSGRWAIHRAFDSADDFSDGLAKVPRFLKTDTMRDVYVDRAGHEVFSVRFAGGGRFSEGFAPYESEGKRGIRDLRPGSFAYRDFPGLMGFIDKTGSVVVPPTYAEVGPFVNGLARVVLDGPCYRLSPDGDRSGSPTTGYPTSCGGAPDEAVAACKTGFIDPAGRVAIQPRFESARDFHEGLAAVQADGRWGFIGPDGAFVIAPQFAGAQSFYEGLAAVRVGAKWGFVDRLGKMAIAPTLESVGVFSNGLALVTGGGKPYYIDRGGKRAFRGSFLEATPFVQGLAAVRVGADRIAYIDTKGKAVFTYERSKQSFN